MSSTAPLDLELEQCLSRLPETQRESITLFYLEEKSVKEVADILDLPEGTVKSHLHRAQFGVHSRASSGPTGRETRRFLKISLSAP